MSDLLFVHDDVSLPRCGSVQARDDLRAGTILMVEEAGTTFDAARGPEKPMESRRPYILKGKMLRDAYRRIEREVPQGLRRFNHLEILNTLRTCLPYENGARYAYLPTASSIKTGRGANATTQMWWDGGQRPVAVVIATRNIASGERIVGNTTGEVAAVAEAMNEDAIRELLGGSAAVPPGGVGGFAPPVWHMTHARVPDGFVPELPEGFDDNDVPRTGRRRYGRDGVEYYMLQDDFVKCLQEPVWYATHAKRNWGFDPERPTHNYGAVRAGTPPFPVTLATGGTITVHFVERCEPHDVFADIKLANTRENCRIILQPAGTRLEFLDARGHHVTIKIINCELILPALKPWQNVSHAEAVRRGYAAPPPLFPEAHLVSQRSSRPAESMC